MKWRSLLTATLAFMACPLLATALTPTLWLKFDNSSLADSSTQSIVSTVTPSNAAAITYTADRFGNANSAIQFAGSTALDVASASGNSNQALGLRNATGTNTAFTLSAWVNFSSVGAGTGYNTIFGNVNANVAANGVLHAGLNTNTAFTHFGFNNNDVTGATTTIVAGQWYHIVFVYDTTTTGQRIYINGIPEVVRTGVTNTLGAADLLIGNWGATQTDSSNDFRGKLDDVLVYNVALSGDQVQALYNNVSPLALPTAGTYSAPPTTLGYRGTDGNWGVHEIKGYPGISYSSLVDIDRILKAQSTVAGGTIADYWSPVINFQDDEDATASQNFPNKGDFGTNTPSDDNSFLLLGRCSINIPAAGTYTFGYRSDDGARLRVVGVQFASSTRVNTSNVANPANLGDTLFYPNGTSDSQTLGVVTFTKAGQYALEFTYFENSGGSGVEVFAAPGAKTAFDSTFQLIGNTAAGGLQIVRDANTVPAFTVNGANSVFVQNGSPSQVTLAWSVADPSTTLTIDNGIGPVAQSGSTTIAAPAITTTYTMTAKTGADTVTKTVTVLVNSPPIVGVTADKSSVPSGASVTLSFNIQGASSATLNPGNFDITALASKVVNPTQTTTYTVSATNVAGTTTQSITITIGLPPVIVSFAASDSNPIYGKDTTLSWNITGSTSQSIDQSIGSVAASSSVGVVPLLSTTYTLTATNAFGFSTKQVQVTLATPIGVNSTGFSVRQVRSITPFPFAGQGYLQSALSLLSGQNVASTVIQNNYQTINFSNGTDGDFTTGNVAFPGGLSDNFACEITGTLIVNTPGEYTFMVNSDDGCYLRINGQDVIVDDATHFASEATGKVTLTGTTATFDLVYYNATGGAEVEVAWQRPNLTLQQLGVISATAPIVRGGVLINEFCASNSKGIVDEDGDASDWIEVWNSTSSAVNLSGYYLSIDPAIPNQWAFPSMTLAANQYLVVFASAKNRTNPTGKLHTNFKLPAGGSYLALKKDNGAGGYTTLTEFNPYPAQLTDVSYGSSDTEGYIGFMEVPTPGQPNAATYTGFIQPVTFSQVRGRMSAPFNLTLSSTPSNAEIRYTTDGSLPSSSHGTVYTGPMNISATTAIRAAAFLAGWKPPIAATNTYLFINDIVNQSTASTVAQGWPSAAVNGQVYRYGMALANVTAGGGDINALKSALSAAPSVCLNLNPDDFFGATNGIFSNPSKRGRFWERAASMEYINADGTSGFQDNCGARVRGNASRSTSNPKHGFHIYFRSDYGGDNLVYPLFGSEGNVTQFNQIDMRCEENYSWAYGGNNLNSLTREEWSRKTQGDMGQPYSRNNYFHLYINGIYWGIYDWEEKTESDFAANMFGGSDDDYDCVKSAGDTQSYNTEMTDGNFKGWQTLFTMALALKNAATETARTTLYYQMQGLNSDRTRNPAYPIYLNVPNLADYLLVGYYNGSFDAPMSTFLSNASNNWFGINQRDGNGLGFLFFCHDNEHGMGTGSQNAYHDYNRVGPWGNPTATSNNWNQTWSAGQYQTREVFTKFNPQYLHEFLCYSSEYRQAFNDRVHRHLLGTGALTVAKSLARADALSAQVSPIIQAESARWGSTSLTKTTWASAVAGVDTFINTGGICPSTEVNLNQPNRTAVVLAQLAGYTDNGAKPLYIALTDPVLSGQAGGLVASGYSFQISNPGGTGTLYYTIDGSDPRASGGTVGSTALTGANPITVTITNPLTTVTARVLNGTNWSGLVQQTYIVGVPASHSNLVVTKVHYNPAPSVVNGEFIELMNISTANVLMTGCNFDKGVTYTFPANYLLAPGARCLVLQSIADFTAANPNVPSNLIAGEYAGKLDNSGERVRLLDALGVAIQDFTYSPDAPWPAEANGTGPCLVLVRPETNPDETLPASWRSSLTSGGAPGAVDGVRLNSWFSTYGITNTTGFGDFDNDGLVDFLEYALGLDPTKSTGKAGTLGTQNVAGSDYLTLTVTHPLGRDDVTSLSAEACTTLSDWMAAVQVSATNNGDGTETLVFRHPSPLSTTPAQFLRLKATK